MNLCHIFHMKNHVHVFLQNFLEVEIADCSNSEMYGISGNVCDHHMHAKTEFSAVFIHILNHEDGFSGGLMI